MKKSIFIILLFSTTLLVYSCKAKKGATPKPTTVLAAAQQRWPDVTAESLAKGKTILTTRCVKCHPAKPFTKYSEKDWEKILVKMTPKAKLNTEEAETLRRYILASRQMNKNE